MEKDIEKKNRGVKHILFRISGALIGLLLINQILYAIIVPLIFFNAKYSEADYLRLQSNSEPVEIIIPTENGTLYGWQIGDHSDTVILYFGGDAVDSNTWLQGALDTNGGVLFQSAILLTVDYPTFGRSTGTMSEAVFYDTAATLYDYAASHYPEASIYAMGYSMGTAAALSLANRAELAGLLLIAPMYDGTSLYLPRESILHTVFEPTATVQMQNDEFAANCLVRTLIVASTDDSMTKQEDVLALAALFPQRPIIELLSDCSHGEYWQKSETYTAIESFLTEQ